MTPIDAASRHANICTTYTGMPRLIPHAAVLQHRLVCVQTHTAQYHTIGLVLGKELELDLELDLELVALCFS